MAFKLVFDMVNLVSMGCSVALMGVMAFLCVDLVRHWHTIAHPVRVLVCIIVYFGELRSIHFFHPSYSQFHPSDHISHWVAAWVSGFTPNPHMQSTKNSTRYDNFSHFGGFIGGALITLATLPMLPSCTNSKQDSKPDQFMLIWLMRILMLAFIAVLMWIIAHLFTSNGLQEVIHEGFSHRSLTYALFLF